MIMTANDREEARIKRLRDQMREQDRLRFANPDRDFELEAIWVIYLWDGEKWILAGFRPRRRRRKPQTMARFCAKVRRKLMIERGTPIKLMGLDRAARLARQNDTAWQFIPPERKPRRVRPDAPDPVFYGKKQPKRRAHDKAIRFHKRDSTFVVLGRNPWERAKGHLFLGPLTIETKRSAEREAARLFPIYNDLVVVATDALSKPLRNQMHSGKRIRAGVTRIVWPEVPPMFPVVWEKAIRKTPSGVGRRGLAVADARMDQEAAQAVPGAGAHSLRRLAMHDVSDEERFEAFLGPNGCSPCPQGQAGRN
jgi:hypothetical protein